MSMSFQHIVINFKTLTLMIRNIDFDNNASKPFFFTAGYPPLRVCGSVWQCVAVCCSVVQRGAACCSVLQCVLQCVAVCCRVLSRSNMQALLGGGSVVEVLGGRSAVGVLGWWEGGVR